MISIKRAIAIGILFFVLPASAVTIDFPKEELANESVLPVFDKLEAVKNRSVPTDGRFELGPQMGFLLNEPFFNNLNYGFTASYHLDETHGVNVFYSLIGDGLSSNGEGLKNVQTATGSTSILLENVPATEYFALLNYQVTPYYGKISVFKDSTMSLSLYGTAGLALLGIDGGTNIGLNFGLGQKLYFTKHIGIRVDLRFLMYNSPDILKPKDITLLQQNPAYPTKLTSDAFESTLKFDSHLSIGLIFLL